MKFQEDGNGVHPLVKNDDLQHFPMHAKNKVTIDCWENKNNRIISTRDLSVCVNRSN